MKERFLLFLFQVFLCAGAIACVANFLPDSILV